MRLGQLSRKVNVKPTEILLYLKNEFDVELGSHLNTKVDDELSDKVIHKFTIKKTTIIPPVIETVVEEIAEPETTANIELEEEITEAISETIIETEPETLPEGVREYGTDEEVDAQTILNATLIKAPKVDLPGPKVVGKIDLPPTLEEQMVEVDGVMISKAELLNRKNEKKREKREKSQGTRKRTSGSVRESRIKSEAQIEQIKKDKLADEMAKRLAHRENRITTKKKIASKKKPNFVSKKTKKRPVPVTEAQNEPKISKPEPTTWHGKLWKWFNT
jgi:hypothetical protein